jgi:DNA polymerase III alpha subunit
MDVDIDLKTNFDPLDYFKTAIRASMIKTDELVKHPAGVYFQDVPVDAITGLCAIPYAEAEELGLLKIDFLHLSLLDNFDSKDEIRTLLKTEPDWFLLESASNVSKLFQISKHYDLVQRIKPRSVQDLADLLALMRPGKRKLLDAYVRDRENVRHALYMKEEGQYSFKRSHALAYALTIVLQLHLIRGGIL